MDEQTKKDTAGFLAYVLSMSRSEAERQKNLAEFAAVLDADWPDWLNHIREAGVSRLGETAATVVKSVEAFQSKRQSLRETGDPDENEAKDIPACCQIRIVFGADFPGGYALSVESVPDLEAMSRVEIVEYLSDLHDELVDLALDEPEDSESPDYEAWEDRCSDLKEQIDEARNRLAELEEEQPES